MLMVGEASEQQKEVMAERSAMRCETLERERATRLESERALSVGTCRTGATCLGVRLLLQYSMTAGCWHPATPAPPRPAPPWPRQCGLRNDVRTSVEPPPVEGSSTPVATSLAAWRGDVTWLLLVTALGVGQGAGGRGGQAAYCSARAHPVDGSSSKKKRPLNNGEPKLSGKYSAGKKMTIFCL